MAEKNPKQKFAKEDTPSTVPIFESVKSLKHVPYTDKENGGAKDAYPRELLRYKGSSSWHGAIIDYKVDQVKGTGFEPLTENVDFDEKTKAFIENCNNKGEDLNEVLSKLAFDKVVFNGFCFMVTWSNDRKSITSIEHVAFDNVRSAKVNAFGNVDMFYYCFDWTKSKYLKQELPAFDSSGAKTIAKEVEEAVKNDDAEKIVRIKSEKNSQLLRVIPYSSINVYYPLPSYVACLSPIRADIHSDIYGENILKNGMSSPIHVNLVGTYSDDEFLNEVENIQYNYTGSKNAGIPFVTRSTTKEQKPEVDTIKNDSKEDRYTTINTATQQKILSGHRVTSPLLVGIAQPGSLGNREELETAYNLFQKSVIQPIQSEIVKSINKVMTINSMQPLKIGKLELFDIEEKETSEIKE